jgi:hypothetical protein
MIDVWCQWEAIGNQGQKNYLWRAKVGHMTCWAWNDITHYCIVNTSVARCRISITINSSDSAGKRGPSATLALSGLSIDLEMTSNIHLPPIEIIAYLAPIALSNYYTWPIVFIKIQRLMADINKWSMCSVISSFTYNPDKAIWKSVDCCTETRDLWRRRY